MADTVRFFMEEMLPEMRDLEQKGIFSKVRSFGHFILFRRPALQYAHQEVEINSIIKKREKFEYALKRRISKKADFLRYIEYEMNLETLRKKRRARMVSDTKVTISDYAGPRRINFIYKRCLKKFHGDMSIWLQYINYVKSTGASRTLGKIFAEAIQLHPMNEKLWILAASWEWEQNANIVAARVLLQRALRLNTTTQSLWHEYFRLELVYIAKILARREILGIDAVPQEEEEDEEMDSDNMIKLPTVTGEEFSPVTNDDDKKEAELVKGKKNKKGKKEKVDEKMTEEKAEKLKTESNPVLRGEVAMVVYHSGIKEIPDSLSFRKGFLDIAHSFIRPKPLKEDSIQIIYDSIARDFQDLPEAKVLVARRAIDAFKVDEEGYAVSLAETVKEFWAICQNENTREWELFVENMQMEHQKTNEENLKLFFEKTIDRIFSTAAKKKVHSEKLYQLQVDWVVANSTSTIDEVAKKALAILDRAVADHPESRALLLQQIRLLKKQSREEQVARLPLIFARALQSHVECFDVWEEYVSFLHASYREEDMTKEQVEEAFLEAIRVTTTMLPDVTEERAEIGQIKDSVGVWFLGWMNEVEGIKGVRRMYHSLMLKSLPDVPFFMACIKFEKQNSEKDPETTRKNIVMLYDKAIHADEKREDTYLSFLNYLNETGQIEEANKVLWRASKAVEDNDTFSQRYREMLERGWNKP
ncbi:U3 snoRNP protein [Podila epigama]|nr:U3 snoRNP protein [Podila epigama]